MTAKNKEKYANKIFNKSYKYLTKEEQEIVHHQYATEHCEMTREDERLIMIHEEYGRSPVPREIGKYFT